MTQAAFQPHHEPGATTPTPFRFGLVGASNIALTWMMPAFAAADITVYGLYDAEPRRFSYWTGSGVEGQTANLDQLLASDIDAVYISSRNDQHASEAVAAAEAGKHILVEKPMALTVADADAMIDAADRHGVVLAVNHHLVGSPLHSTARQLVTEGRIGNLLAARVNHAGTLPAHLRGWRLSGAPGAGVILDLTVHDASVLNPLFGAGPSEVSSMATSQATWNSSAAYDSVMSVLRYPGQTADGDRLAFAHDSFAVAAPRTSLEILGDEAALVISDAMNQDTAGSVHLHTAADVEPVEVDCTPGLYEIVLNAFVAAVHGDGRPTVTGSEGLLALRVALAAQRSAAEGQTVRPQDLT